MDTTNNKMIKAISQVSIDVVAPQIEVVAPQKFIQVEREQKFAPKKRVEYPWMTPIGHSSKMAMILDRDLSKLTLSEREVKQKVKRVWKPKFGPARARPTVERFDELLEEFFQKGKWSNVDQRKEFDRCIRLNWSTLRKERVSAKSLAWFGRWPTATYKRLYADKQKVCRQKLAKNVRKAFRFEENRFYTLPVYSCRQIVYDEEEEEEFILPKQKKVEEYQIPLPEYGPRPGSNIPTRNLMFRFCLRVARCAARNRMETQSPKILALVEYNSKMVNDFIAYFEKKASKVRFLKRVSVSYSDFIKYRTKVNVKSDRIVGQMESATPSDSGEIKPDVKSNTIVTSDRPVETSLTLDKVPSDFWSKLSSSEKSRLCNDTADRHLVVCTFKWETSHTTNTMLCEKTLPLDVIEGNNSSPNAMMFMQNAYWKGDIDVYVKLDSNQFQVGQLIVSWYYSSTFDSYSSVRNTVAASVQLPHLLIDANIRNPVKFSIPYRYYKSLLTTYVTDSENNVRLNLGTIRVMVLNPLLVTSKTNIAVNGYLTCSFPNSSFSGLIPRNFIRGNMFASVAVPYLVRLATKTLNQIAPDSNRDNPPVVAGPSLMMPQPAQSWCTGTNDVDTVSPLRLNPCGQTPHWSGSSTVESETVISSLVRKWGFVNTVEWTRDHLTNSMLVNLAVAPLMLLSVYTSVKESGSEVSSYNIPPIGCVSALNCYWRGKIEFRLDIVSSNFQVGSLILAYVPRTLKRTFTISDLKNCYYSIISVGEQKRFTFVCPYISDKPWWPRSEKYELAKLVQVNPPGYFVVLVVNPLSVMDNIPSKVYINVYMRGGNDFEVSIPNFPMLSYQYGPPVPYPKDYFIVPKAGYGNSMYAGMWHTTGTSLILRYDTGSDHITQWDGVTNNFLILKNFGKSKIYADIYIDIPAKTHEYVELVYFCRFKLEDDDYVYMTGFKDQVTAKAYIAGWKIHEKSASPSALTHQCYVDGPWVTTPIDVKLYVPAAIGQMNDDQLCGEVLQPFAESTMSTSSGLLTFGEAFRDLKDYCRRYQLYTSFDLKIEKTSIQRFLAVNCYVPIFPIGLESDNNSTSTRYMYSGIIPYILSAYRFYRGSLRFRFAITCSENVTVYIQHRPEMVLTSRKVVMFSNTIRTGPEHVISPGYASYVLDTRINPFVTIEIPFYHPANLGLLQAPDFSKISEITHYGMGAFLISCDSAFKSDLRINMFYCLGDDFKPSCFIGFPNLQPVLEPTRTLDIVENYIGQMNEPVQGQMFSYLKRNVKETTDEIKDDITSSFKEVVSGKIDGIMGIFKDLTKDIKSETKYVMLNCISQLVHILINPTAATVATAFVFMLVSSGLFLYEWSDKIISVVKPVFEQFLGSVTSQETEGEGRVVGQFDSSDCSAFVSTMVGAICAVLRVKYDSKRAGKIPNFAESLTLGIMTGTKMSNMLFIFLRNNIEMLYKIINWVISRFVGNRYENLVISDIEGYKMWVRDVQIILDPANELKLQSDPTLVSKVYSCAAVAQAIQHRFVTSEISDPKVVRARSATLAVCKDIFKLREEVVKNKYCPPVSFEPFCICHIGEPGIGKTHIGQELVETLLRSINYQTFDDIMLVRTPGNPYWNGCRNQPFVVYDDFLQINEAPFSHQDISELMILKSKAMFNPRQAAIEEKMVRYNPIGVVLNMNNGFPQVAGVADNTAWMRRRDVCVKVELKKQYLGMVASSIDKKVLENNGHLEFSIFIDSRSEQKGFLRDHVALSWDQYKDYTSRTFHAYYQKETREYIRRIKALDEFRPDCDGSVAEVLMAYDKFVTRINLKELTPREQREYGRMAQELNNANLVLNHSESNFTVDILRQVDSSLHRTDSPFSAIRGIIGSEPSNVTHLLIDGLDNRVSGQMPTIENQSIPLASTSRVKPCFHDLFHAKDCDFIKFQDQMCFFNSDIMFREECGEEAAGVVLLDRPCAHEPDCPWHNKKTFENAMENWKQQHKLYFIGDSKMPLPNYFLSNAKKNFKEHFSETYGKVFGKQVTKVVEDLDIMVKGRDQLVETKLGKIGKWIYWFLKKMCGYLKAFVSFFIPSIATIKATGRLAATGIILGAGSTLGMGATMLGGGLIANRYQKHHPKYLEQMSYDISAPKINRGGLEGRAPGKVIGEMAPEQESVIMKKIVKNTFFLILCNSDGGTEIKARCFALGGKYALVLKHYYNYMQVHLDNLRVFMLRNGTAVEINLTDCKFKSFSNSELMVMELPKYIPSFPNIVNFIMTTQQSQTMPTRCFLYEIELAETIDEPYNILKTIENCKIKDELTIDISIVGAKPNVVNRVIEYQSSRMGLCGSILVADVNTPNPIVGIHIAGNERGTSGFSECITKEMFDTLFKDKIVVSQMDRNVVDNPISIVKARLMIGNTVDNICVVEPKLAHSTPGTSKLEPSVCANVFFPATYEIPCLHPRDPRFESRGVEKFSPLLESCKFHGEVPVPFPTDVLDIAIDDFRRVILDNVKPVRVQPGVLTREQSIMGIPGLKYYEGMELDTSEGFPFSSQRPRGAMNKRWLFDIDKDNILQGVHPKLVEVLDEKEKLRKEGFITHTVFVDCLKDQKLPKEKVMKPGKTRTFSISPVDYTIHFRQYFLDFMTAYQDARLEAEHTLGINGESIEWDQLARHLLDMSPCIVTGDYSKYGPTLMHSCVMGAFDIILDWFKLYTPATEEDQQFRKILIEEMVFSEHLMWDLIYKVFCGAPSGSPITSIMNSLVNSLYIRCSWLLIFNKGLKKIEGLDEYLGMSGFRKFVRMISNGDDLIMAVAQIIVKYFNASTIQQALGAFGVIFTDAIKSGNTIPYSSLFDETTTYLKSYFIRHPYQNLIIRKLDSRAVQETCNWIMKSRDPEGMSQQACKAMMLNAFGLGKDWYETTRTMVCEWWSQRGRPIDIPSWEDENSRMYGDKGLQISKKIMDLLL